jgi:ABC-type glycerol-3-phosphate transport system permease component
MIGAALAPLHEISGMVIWPVHPGWGNFRYMIDKIPILRSLMNSLLLASITTSLVLITGSTVGYALAKMRFKGRQEPLDSIDQGDGVGGVVLFSRGLGDKW